LNYPGFWLFRYSILSYFNLKCGMWDLIVIELKNGAIFCFPPKLAQGLEGASPEQLADVWLPPSGSSVHWESLDVDFGIPELLAGIFGTKSWRAD
ncbi:DUF2442 domain-containing protein, partial [Microcoleus sp. S13_D1]